MKKKRLIILLSILMVVAIIGCFTFLYRAAAVEKDAFYYYHVTDNEDTERLGKLPEQIELRSGSELGFKVHFLDYSITISGYDEAVIDKENDLHTAYNVSVDKRISFENMNLLTNGFFNDPVISSQINKAAGREINNEYDFLEASFYCTPDDFSLLDADKNKGVSIMLEKKCSILVDGYYQFNNGIVKGFIYATSGSAIVMFSNCEISDSFYQIIFYNFSIEEVKDMLGTITFDASKAD